MANGKVIVGGIIMLALGLLVLEVGHAEGVLFTGAMFFIGAGVLILVAGIFVPSAWRPTVKK